MEGHGMSRAAQKKRKRQHKFNSTKTQVNKLHLPMCPSASPNESECDELPSKLGSTEFVSQNQLSHGSKFVGSSKKGSWKMFDRTEVQHPLSLAVHTTPISKILQLKDTYECLVTEKSALLLSKIIFPHDRLLFYEQFWEKTPAVFTRATVDASYFGKFFTKKAFKAMVTEHVLKLGIDVDIIDGEGNRLVSVTDSDDVHALPVTMDGGEIWSNYTKQHAIALLQPQVYNDNIWNLCSSLEYEFGCRVDPIITLQPSQHKWTHPPIKTHQFALQLEGNTKWTLKKDQTYQPYISNENLLISDSEQSFNLRAGDSLYIPFGWKATVETSDMGQSLILSLQTSNSNSVSTLFKIAVTQAVENLQLESRLFRKLLPPDIRDYLGVPTSENEDDPKRQILMSDLTKLCSQVMTQAIDIIDPAHDQLFKQFILERLPPALREEEENQTAAKFPDAVIYPYTQLRIVRPGIAIAVVEEGKVVVYHAMDNSRELFGNSLSPLEFELDDGPSIEALLNSYPQPIVVSELEHPSEDIEDKVGVAQALYKEGLLMIVDEASQPKVESSDDDSQSPF